MITAAVAVPDFLGEAAAYAFDVIYPVPLQVGQVMVGVH